MESEGMVLKPEIISPGVQAVFDDPNESKGHYLIAMDDEQYLGCLLITTEWSDWRNGTILWIQSLFVIPEARGKKVFKQMYEYMQAMVKDNDSDFRGIRLYVEKENQRAIDVYEKIGMNGTHYNFYEWIP